MSFQNILINQEGKLAVVTINRPEKLNALNKLTITELHQAFTDLNADENVRCIILIGAGNKAFVAGADINEFASFSTEDGKKLSAEGHEKLFDFIENLGTPVIAAINGYALGGGLELAMACHMRVIVEEAKIGLPEVTLGLIPGYGGTQRLAQLVGKGKALELIATAGMIGGTEAGRLGLANYVCSPENLLKTAFTIGLKIAENSPSAIAAGIRAVNAGYQSGVDGYQAEINEFGKCFGTKDFQEGTSAFIEKRKPNF